VVVHEIEKPLEVVRAPIETVKSTARWIGGALKRREFPAFYTADALADATRHCRRGWALDPAIETGAALIGVLCSCPRTGEFFAVVTAAEPIEHAEETRLSLTFSATSWDAIEQRLEQLRKQSGCAALRLLGQAHGHPFMPAQCREDERSAIRAHTAYASSDDIAWSRSVFSREPWQLCHIFGRDSNGTAVHALHGLRNGTLMHRPFGVVQKFDW
jgi:hypothetical protein